MELKQMVGLLNKSCDPTPNPPPHPSICDHQKIQFSYVARNLSGHKLLSHLTIPLILCKCGVLCWELLAGHNVLKVRKPVLHVACQKGYKRQGFWYYDRFSYLVSNLKLNGYGRIFQLSTPLSSPFQGAPKMTLTQSSSSFVTLH